MAELQHRAIRNAASELIYTIGYEGLSLDNFFRALGQAGVVAIYDVRYNPGSRKPGFSGHCLKRRCDALGLVYVGVPSLGIPREFRQNVVTPNDRLQLWDRYRRHVLSREKELIARIASDLVQLPSALLCFEANPLCCHRHVLADVLSSLTGLEVCHYIAEIPAWVRREDLES